MFVDFSRVRLFIRPGHTDMRKQANGLSVVVQEHLKADPFSGNLFLFSNKRKNILKILYWDRNGFCMWKKRLEKNRFPWPEKKNAAIEIGEKELRWLLDGIDFWHTHESLSYSSVIQYQ